MIDAGVAYVSPTAETDRVMAEQLRECGALVQGSWDADVIDERRL